MDKISYCFCNGIGNFVIALAAIEAHAKKHDAEPIICIPNFDHRFHIIKDMTSLDARLVSTTDFAHINESKAVYEFWCYPRQYHVDNRSIVQRKPDWLGGANEFQSYCEFLDIQEPETQTPRSMVVGDIDDALRFDVVIANGCAQSWDMKKTSPDRLRKIIASILLHRPQTTFGLIGSFSESEEMSRVAESFTDERVSNVTHLLIRQSIGAISAARVVLCNDTAMMHVADALLKPIVALWGWTLESKNAPRWSKDVRIIQSSGGGCEHFPCYGKRDVMQVCKNEHAYSPCMKDIDIDEAARAVLEFL